MPPSAISERPSFPGSLALGLAMLAAFLLGGAAQAADGADRPRTVKLVVTLVWEGRDLEEYNLRALEKFRGEFSDIQLVHFVSPAYFLRDGVDAGVQAAKIRALMRPGDRIGVTLSGWRSLTAKADVIFRSGPTFWGESLRAVDCAVDCGQDVPVNVYPEQDLEKMIATSLRTLEDQGFGRVKGLLTSGWVASPEVLAGAVSAGIRYDFSAVAAEMLSKRARAYPLYGWVKSLWPTITPHTQPHVLTTASSGLTEVPQSLGALDYVGVDDTLLLFKEYAEMARRDSGRELTFPLVLYQETAQTSLPVVKRALTAIFAHATLQGISLAPMELPGMELTGSVAIPVAH
jgi:hypothetical protein